MTGTLPPCPFKSGQWGWRCLFHNIAWVQQHFRSFGAEATEMSTKMSFTSIALAVNFSIMGNFMVYQD